MTTPVHARSSRRVLPLAAAVAVASAVSSTACKPTFDVPAGAKITCQSSDDCPSGYRCDQNFCISATGNQAPSLVVSATARGAVTIPVEVTVLDSELDDVSVSAEYAVQQAGGSWSAFTPATLSGATGLSTAHGTNGHTIAWNAVADAGVIGSPLSTWSSQADPDLPAATTVLSAAQVKLRLTPTDAHGLAGTPVESAPFLVGDTAAVATFASPPAQLGGIAVLEPTVADDESDVVDLIVQFRGDPADVWRTASVVVGDTVALSSSPIPPGVAHPIAWDTSAAPNDGDPTAPQGLGRTNHPQAELRLGTRQVIGGVEVHGVWSAPVAVTVRNQTGPRVIALEARRGVLTPGRSPIAITYDVADEEGDPVDARIGYSIDGGVTFTPCPEYPVPFSEGLYDLATTPVVQGGIWHTFVWDAGSGLELPDSVVVQVEVANRLGDTPGDPLAGRTGQAQVILPGTLHTASSIVGTAFEERELALTVPVNSVIATDLNGDGVLDVLVATRDTRFKVTTYFGVAGPSTLGVDTFNPGTTYDLGPAPSVSVWGDMRLQYVDVDGDGKRDVVFHSEHGAGWLHGLGGGAFAVGAHAFTSATDLGGGLCLGDLDGDGLLDVVLTYGVENNDTVGGFQVQLATSPGVFGPPVRTQFSRLGSSLCAIGDFNGDGHLDVVINEYGDSQLFAGDGTGGFHLLATASRLTFPTNYVVADLDGDGIDDLAMGQFDLPLVGVWLGSRATPFPPARYFSTSGGFVNGLAATDLDGDGRIDLLTDLDVLRQTYEPGVFDTGVRLDPDGGRVFGGTSPGGLTFAAIARPSAVRLVNRKPQGNWPGQGTRGDFRSDTNPFIGAMTAADVDLDGRPDLTLAATFTTDGLLGNGRLSAADGTFSPAARFLQPSYGGSVVWGDLDGDGLDDLVYDDMVHVGALLRGPAPDLATPFHAEFQYYDGVQDTSFLRDTVDSLLVVDLDGVGTPEIVATRLAVDGTGAPLEKRLVVLRPGSAQLDPVTQIADGSMVGMPFVPVRRFDAGDLDGDGLLDLVSASADLPASPPAFELQVRIYRQGPAGTFTPAGAFALPPGEPGVRDLRLADVDDDGILDLLVAGTQTIYVYRGLGTTGRGNGAFAAPVSIPTVVYPSQLAFGDLDGDGVLDLVVPSLFGGVGVLRGGSGQGLANGSFTSQPSLTSGSAWSVALADMNGDGFEDVAVGTTTGASVFLSEPLDMLAWQTRPLTAVAGRPGTLYAPGLTAPVFTDAFGRAPAPDLLGYHPRREGLEAFDRRVRQGVGRGASLVPLSLAYDVTGRTRLTRRTWPAGGADVRVAVETREGPATTGIPWVVVPIPVAQARAGTVWATADVVVVRETPNWVRASAAPLDPAASAPDAVSHLPLITAGDGAVHDIIAPRYVQTVIPRDADGDLATGSGPRFVVDTTTSPPVIRVYTDELGTFRAYLRFTP